MVLAAVTGSCLVFSATTSAVNTSADKSGVDMQAAVEQETSREPDIQAEGRMIIIASDAKAVAIEADPDIESWMLEPYNTVQEPGIMIEDWMLSFRR
jgi:hypothetical protein